MVALTLILCNFIYRFSHDNGGVELYKYHTQAMYHEDFAESGIYPDLFLRLEVGNKTVRIPHDERPYCSYSTYGRDEEDGNPFDRNYLIDNDYVRYFKEYAGKVDIDGTLPDKEAVARRMAPHMEKFTDLGIANDMLRYTFLLNKEEEQQASAFWYSWYYHSFAERESKEVHKDGTPRYVFPHVYVNLDSLADGEELVALWDDTENLYLMNSGFYENI